MNKMKRYFKSMAGGEELTGFMFVTPFILGFLLFTMVPLLSAIVVSFTDLNSLGALMDLGNLKFIGFDNFVEVFKDQSALWGFVRSFIYMIIFVPANLVFSLILAVLFNAAFRFKKVSTTMIFTPYVTNIVAISMVMALILNPYDGPINKVLGWLGIHNLPMWLGGQYSALPTIALISVWNGLAFYVIIFMVALKNVPADMYEAASMDGAGRLRRLWNITLPLVSPTTFMVVITSIIASFQNYAVVQTLTKGGPGDASRVITLNIYEEAFTSQHYAFATAQAVLLFIIILLITFSQWKLQKKWVHY